MTPTTPAAVRPVEPSNPVDGYEGTRHRVAALLGALRGLSVDSK